MSADKITVAVAGAGDVAMYLVEELLADGRYNVVVLSRAERKWFQRPGVDLRVTDYTFPSLLSILDSTSASVLFSLLHDNTSFFLNAHTAMLQACQASQKCKRFVPSECGGDIDTYPRFPRFYVPTHGAVRELLRKQGEVEWTLLNGGWFMDYFVPAVPTRKTYMKSVGDVWPIDAEKFEAKIPGTGEERIGYTAVRDLAKAAVRLVETPKWDEHTYVCGEVTTWNKAVELLEKYYDRKFKVTYIPVEDVEADIAKYAHDPLSKIVNKAYMDEWNYSEASALPQDKVLDQRKRFFEGIHFRTISELLKDAERLDIV